MSAATTPQPAPPVTLRVPCSERELNFVRNSWLLSFKKARPARIRYDDTGHVTSHRQMPWPEYVVLQNRRINATLARPTVTTLLAESRQVPGTLCGWSCVEATSGGVVVHYVYVAQAFRRFGVARALLAGLEHGAASYSHWTPVVDALPVPAAWTWDPIGGR